MVLRSSVVTVKPGQLLDSHSPLGIPAGGEIAYITPDGSEHRLSGPYRGVPLAGTAASGPRALARLARLARLIAANGPSGAPPAAHAASPPAPAKAFAIDIASSATVCARSDTTPPLLLWRARSDTALTAHLARARNGKGADLAWPAGTAIVPWPAGLPLRDNEAYFLRVAGSKVPVTLLIHLMPKAAMAAASTAAVDGALWLAAHGCTAQGRRLLGLR